MTAHEDPIVETAERLCRTLERIGDALVSMDADTLLETEETLSRVLAALAAAPSANETFDRDALRARVKRAAEALLRCRRLGASFASIAGPRLRLRSGSEIYGRGGEFVEHAVSGSAVRVST